VVYGPAVGLLTAALAAASYWMLQESRLGMRPIALPLFLALASGFGWVAARHARAWAWPAAGLALGLSLYTYLPARLFPLLVAGQVGVGLWTCRRNRIFSGRAVIGVASFGVASGVGAPPLGV